MEREHYIMALEKYRAACKSLLSKRYRDGECDAVALSNFEDEIKEAEDYLEENA